MKEKPYSNGYGLGALTPLTANIIQWFRTKAVALITLSVFALGSLICDFAPNFHTLLCGRLIQTISAALMIPLLINTIFAIYPPSRRGRVMSLVTMMFTVAPAIGPTLSGIILDHLGWHYLFLLPLPLITIAFLAVDHYLNVNVVEITKPEIDLLSALLSSIGFGGVVFSISHYAYLFA